MTYSEKKLAKQIQLEKDNQYILKQFFKLQANRAEILIRLKAYQSKYPRRGKTDPIHITRLIKYLGINRRAIYLLEDKQFFNLEFSWDYRMFDCREVVKFIKSLPE